MTYEFPDQLIAFQQIAQQAAERQRQARKMVDQALETNGQMVGSIYVPKSPLLSFAQGFTGSAMNRMAEDEVKDAISKRDQAQGDWQGRYSAAPDDATRQSLLVEARNKGLRYDLENAFRKEEADRIEKGEQLALTREEAAKEKAAQREFLANQGDLNRQSRIDLKQTPSIVIHSGNGGGQGKAPSGYRWTASGDLEAIPGGPGAKAQADKPLNENQGNAMIYGTRGAQANNILESVGTQYSPMKLDIARSASKVPGGAAVSNTFLLGENEQKVDQAQRNFINAILRRESGASIHDSEFENARKQYFPQQGDSEAVLAQKKANRELVIKSLGDIAGPQGQKAVKAEQANKPQQSDKLTPAEQAELEQLRAKHGRK